MFDNIHPDDIAKASSELAALLQDPGGTLDFEVRARIRDGPWRIIAGKARNLLHHPAVEGIVINFRDITERKQAEERLWRSEERLRFMFEGAMDGISIADAEGVVTEVNKREVQMLGFSTKEEMLGKNSLEFFAPRDRERVMAAGQEAIQKGAMRVECTLLCADGSEFLGEVNAGALKDIQGHWIGFVGITRDITERKRAEETLRESERRYRLLAENATDVITSVDMSALPIYMSPSITRLLGYSVEEAMNRTLEQSLTPASYRAAIEGLAGAVAGDPGEQSAQSGSRTVELEFYRKDGSTVWVEDSVSIVRDSHGQPLEIVSVLRDITQRKRAEEALRASESKYRALFEAVLDGVIVVDAETLSIVAANEAAAKMYGLGSAKDSVGMSLFDFMAPEEREHVVRAAEDVIGKDLGRVDRYRTLAKDGREIWVSALAIRTEYEGRLAALISLRNITEHKQAEEALRQSEENFRALAENASDGIIITRINGGIAYANRQAAEIAGYTVDGLLKLDVKKLAYPGRLQQLLRQHKERLEGKSGPSRYETIVVQKDGGVIATDIAAATTTWHGKPATMFFIRDITERKRAEEALQKAKEFTDSLITSMQDGLSVLDSHGVHIDVNPAFCWMTGFSREELIGTGPPHPYWPPESLEAIERAFQKTLKGEFEGFELTFMRKDGGRFPVIISPSSVKDRQGNVVSYFATVKDITERRKTEEQLIVTDRLASVGELASGIAHEINNPLTSIIGFSELLLGRDVPDDIKEDLSIINREAHRTAGVVRNLLTFARKHTPAKQPVSLNSIIEKTMELRAYEHRVNNIQVDIRFAPDLPEVMADAFQLQQVFLNIIINAEHFMLQTHGRGTFTITTERVGDIIRSSLADDGPGIAPENLGHIFDPFFTTKEVGEGTGLGLSICHGITTEHGGRIYAKSQLGKGATFVVELPVAR
jgi:two-component system NtrC family sensor kinase